MSGTRAISTTSRRELSSSFSSLQGKAPEEIHAILTETLACVLPGRAKDLSAPLYYIIHFNNIETRAIIKFFPLQGKAPKEIHAILTETLACFLPGRAKDLSAPLHNRRGDAQNAERRVRPLGSEKDSKAKATSLFINTFPCKPEWRSSK